MPFNRSDVKHRNKHRNKDGNCMITTVKPLGTDILQRIGNTPLVRLETLTANMPGIQILGKAEWTNPGGSVKDRAASSIVTDAGGGGGCDLHLGAVHRRLGQCITWPGHYGGGFQNALCREGSDSNDAETIGWRWRSDKRRYDS